MVSACVIFKFPFPFLFPIRLFAGFEVTQKLGAIHPRNAELLDRSPGRPEISLFNR
jgi:hypothetical protein